MQDTRTGVPPQELRDQQRTESAFKEKTYKTFTRIRNELTKREGAFDQVKKAAKGVQAQTWLLRS